jgi:hypothetical protein
MGTGGRPGRFKVSVCDSGGIPVTSSSFDFSWRMLHEGVIRRSEPAFSDVIWMGMSPAVCRLMFGGGRGVVWGSFLYAFGRSGGGWVAVQALARELWGERSGGGGWRRDVRYAFENNGGEGGGGARGLPELSTQDRSQEWLQYSDYGQRRNAGGVATPSSLVHVGECRHGTFLPWTSFSHHPSGSRRALIYHRSSHNSTSLTAITHQPRYSHACTKLFRSHRTSISPVVPESWPCCPVTDILVSLSRQGYFRLLKPQSMSREHVAGKELPVRFHILTLLTDEGSESSRRFPPPFCHFSIPFADQHRANTTYWVEPCRA